MTRAPTSAEPPGAKGTRRRTARLSQSWLCAATGAAAARASSITHRRDMVIDMPSPLCVDRPPILTRPRGPGHTPTQGCHRMPFSTYLPEHMGTAVLTPPGPFVAGSHAELSPTSTAGTLPVHDTSKTTL